MEQAVGSFKNAIAHSDLRGALDDCPPAHRPRCLACKRDFVTGPVRSSQLPSHPLLRRPAEMPLMVSWMPVSTFSLAARERCSFKSSTCTWLSGSR